MPLCTAHEGCQNEATHTFAWPWGDNGLCCAEHQVLLHQQAHNLRREVYLTPLQPGEPPPITREERITAQATILALNEENAELRRNNLDMYRTIERLQGELRVELAKVSSLDASLAEARANMTMAQKAHGELVQRAADAEDEARRLRSLLPLPENVTREIDVPSVP